MLGAGCEARTTCQRLPVIDIVIPTRHLSLFHSSQLTARQTSALPQLQGLNFVSQFVQTNESSSHPTHELEVEHAKLQSARIPLSDNGLLNAPQAMAILNRLYTAGTQQD